MQLKQTERILSTLALTECLGSVALGGHARTNMFMMLTEQKISQCSTQAVLKPSPCRKRFKNRLLKIVRAGAGDCMYYLWKKILKHLFSLRSSSTIVESQKK